MREQSTSRHLVNLHFLEIPPAQKLALDICAEEITNELLDIIAKLTELNIITRPQNNKTEITISNAKNQKVAFGNFTPTCEQDTSSINLVSEIEKLLRGINQLPPGSVTLDFSHKTLTIRANFGTLRLARHTNFTKDLPECLHRKLLLLEKFAQKNEELRIEIRRIIEKLGLLVNAENPTK